MRVCGCGRGNVKWEGVTSKNGGISSSNDLFIKTLKSSLSLSLSLSISLSLSLSPSLPPSLPPFLPSSIQSPTTAEGFGCTEPKFEEAGTAVQGLLQGLVVALATSVHEF